MIYGLYLSATGVMTNSYRQDVLANNLANAETVGFKRDLAMFRERRPEAVSDPSRKSWSNSILDEIGGGVFSSPTAIDRSQGELEPTGNDLDVAIQGTGFFKVLDQGKHKLTRDGRFMVDRSGRLVLSNSSGTAVTDEQGNPIVVDPSRKITITGEGQVNQDGFPFAKLGVFDVSAESGLIKGGNNLLSHSDTDRLTPVSYIQLRPQFVERANVDPATELTALMDAQRQLEANANMIRYQDQTLGRLVNEVGKIG